MPLTFVGAICLMYGFQREVGEYASNRIMPIVADSANYLMEETAETTGEYVNTVLEKSGKNMGKILNQGFGQKEVVKIRCPYCKELNDENAKYCDNCGSKL